MTESSVPMALLAAAVSVVFLAIVLVWIGRALIHELRLQRDVFKGIEARLRGVEDALVGMQKELRSGDWRDRKD